MPIPAPELEQLMRRAFPDAEIELKDLAGDNDHYAITIASAAFAGKTRIQQHKTVQAALEGRDLHALQITTKVKD